MKKQFTTFLMSATMMLVATAFTACSSEVEIDDNTGGGKSTAQTIFSSGDDDATRTSVDNKALFFWEKGDKIWIDTGTGFVSSSQSDITAAKQARAKFMLDGNYTALSYNVLYTGYTNNDTTTTSYSTVTIADQQTQKSWNDGSHLGTSGDCGTGTAHKKPGGYQFSLEHKASYLLFYPYLDNTLSSNNYTLEKIEILADGQYIAGQFDFTFANGLADTPIAGQGKQSITLTCGTSGFQLSGTVPDVTASNTTYNHCFVVIAPGTHRLTIRYFTKNSSGTEFVFVKDLAMTKYEPNGVYPYIHVLKDAVVNRGFTFFETRLYQWGASTHINGANPDCSTSTTELTSGFWATTPSRAELIEYCQNSNYPYWDNATEWTFVKHNGTQEIRRGGAWIKKLAYRTQPYTGSSLNTPILGRPDEAVLYQYFFLPAIQLDGVTRFWSRTANGVALAHCFMISKTSIGLSGDYQRHNAGFAYQRPDGTAWFQ